MERNELVPRVCHRIWLGGPEPSWTAGFRRGWERHGWTMWDWTDWTVHELFPLENQDVWDRAHELAPRHVGQLRSDLLRYELLWRYGGVYADHDFELLKPLDPLIEGADCFAAWEVQDRWLANGLMGCTPGHPFVRLLIDGLALNVKRNKGFKPNRMTGPQYLTATFRGHGQGVRTIPQSAVFPYSWREIKANAPGQSWGDATLVHHWSNKRRERNVPVAA